MKKLAILMFLFVGIIAFAQQPENGQRKKPNFSPEQKAELKAKHMALILDLDKKQIQQVKEIELKKEIQIQKMIEERKQKKIGDSIRPSDEELFKMKTAQLDRQKDHQDEMKNILTPVQYEKWKENSAKQMKKKQVKRNDIMQKRKGNEKGKRMGKL